MSFVVTLPAEVAAASENLAGLGSTLFEATTAAAGPTTSVATAAADEISLAISQLFGTFGQEFQTVNAQAAAFHNQFVGLLNGGAAAYAEAEIANAQQNLLRLGLGVPSAAPTVPGGAYVQLLVNTATNLQALSNTFAANPFPFLRQFLANQLGYFGQIPNTILNLPATLAGLPTNIRLLLTHNWAQQIAQFASAQIGYTQAFVGALNRAFAGLVAGVPGFVSQLGVAFQTALTGDFFGAVQDVGAGLARLAITGVDPGTPTVSVNTQFPTSTSILVGITGAAFPVPLGPLPDFFTAIGVIGQDAQYLTNLIPPATVPRQISQNFTNVITATSDPTISALATLDINAQIVSFLPPSITATATGTLSAFFGLPIVLSYAAIGGPINLLNGIATSATSLQQALATGNLLGAFGAVVDSPAVVTNAFLNGQVVQDIPIVAPIPGTPITTPFTPPLPSAIFINLHLPLDGILVPPHFVTATVSTNSQIPIPGLPFEATIFGTPFMGAVPLLLNYLPQQYALAIRPPG